MVSARFDKVNFAVGEPTLCPWLPDLILRAKQLGCTTSMVANGSRVTPEWLDLVENSLDWATLSIDTVDPQKLEASGRTTRNGPLSEDDYLGVIDLLKERGIRLKINTVVARSNCDEALTGFIATARPARWKLLQVLPVSGQNDGLVDDLVITPEQFAGYVDRNRCVEAMGVAVVPEDNDLMTGSYVMVDPAGRFFDNVAGAHVYSRPINDVGVGAALREVSVDPENSGCGMACMIGKDREDIMPEREVTPRLPTSGQIIGALVARLGIRHSVLQSRTARRYFSADPEYLMKDSSRSEIIEAIAEVLTGSGFIASPQTKEDNYELAPAFAAMLRWHADHWDLFRSFLRRRTISVMPSHLPKVWEAYVRLAVIDTVGIRPELIYRDVASDGSLDRQGWRDLATTVRPGDTIVVRHLVRIGRNLQAIGRLTK